MVRQPGEEVSVTVANHAAVHVLTAALEAIMAHWLATIDGDRAAALVRDLETATARSAAAAPMDPFERDRFLLEVDKFGGAFFDRLRLKAEALRTGRKPLK